jgi:hypothetical protein
MAFSATHLAALDEERLGHDDAAGPGLAMRFYLCQLSAPLAIRAIRLDKSSLELVKAGLSRQTLTRETAIYRNALAAFLGQTRLRRVQRTRLRGNSK